MQFIPTLLLVATLLVALPSQASAFGSGGHFGAGFANARRADLYELKSTPRSFAGKRVRIRGRVADVCKNSGCWLVVADGEDQMKVTIRNHAFAVPPDIDGRRVVVEGYVTRTRGRNPVVSVIATGVEVQ
jgi:hypothetical protein